MSDPSANFPTTRWTLLAPRPSATPTDRAQAAEHLCQMYWRPVRHYIERCGGCDARGEAEDLTQDFFAKLGANGFELHADPTKGRLRSYILGAVKHHLAAARRKKRAQKRGGAAVHVSLTEWDGAEDASQPTPDQVFDRAWALDLVDRSLAILEASYAARGKGEYFRALAPLLDLDADADSTLASAARARLGLSPGSLRVALHRLRTRSREILRSEVASTLRPGESLDDEVSYLASLLRPATGRLPDPKITPRCNARGETDQ